jgi:hypothetical protein
MDEVEEGRSEVIGGICRRRRRKKKRMKREGRREMM